ncbi:hypothetical protein [Streptomyces sp. NRRL F-2580]|uniref:hypothetical protein n=1 Tax=Streptomyces sp. NRRL F-2580 TaxID=1463841 RepID=UPI001F3DF392|nr:hypothetical protein [Streptomyces sp. NRRL F-2580]
MGVGGGPTGGAEVLRSVGEHLGRHARADLLERVRIGTVPVKQNRRAERKRALTKVSSSRWAGAITRASEDQFQLSLRCLFDERASLRRTIAKIRQRLAAPCGRRGRGKRSKTFRRIVTGLPAARFRERLRDMAHHAGLVVVAVDPAYTSRWGGRHWKAPLQQQSKTTLVTGHHAAATAFEGAPSDTGYGVGQV